MHSSTVWGAAPPKPAFPVVTALQGQGTGGRIALRDEEADAWLITSALPVTSPLPHLIIMDLGATVLLRVGPRPGSGFSNSAHCFTFDFSFPLLLNRD